jgi:hypothetical protein
VAFVEVSRWDHSPVESVFELRAWHKADRPTINLAWLRRPAGLMMACLLHLAAGWILLQYAGVAQDMAAAAPGAVIKLFSFSPDHPPSEVAQSAAPDQAPGQTSVQVALQQKSVPTLEWSRSRIRMARPVEIISSSLPGDSTNSAPVPMQIAGGGLPSGGGGGKDAYDPYAGASPQRSEDKGRAGIGVTALAAPSPILPALPATSDPQNNIMIVLERELKQRFPTASGRFAIAVRLDGNGRVTDLVDRRGNADRAMIAWLRARLTGMVLKRTEGTSRSVAMIDLPEIRI